MLQKRLKYVEAHIIILLSQKDSKEYYLSKRGMRRKGNMAFKDKELDDPDEDYEIEKDDSLFD